MRKLVEARCPNVKCSKTHLVYSVDGEITQTAFCPPNKHHRGWRDMVPGAPQAESAKVRRAS